MNTASDFVAWPDRRDMKRLTFLRRRISVLALGFAASCGGVPEFKGPLAQTADSIFASNPELNCPGGRRPPAQCWARLPDRIAFFYTDSTGVVTTVGIALALPRRNLFSAHDSAVLVFSRRFGSGDECPHSDPFFEVRDRRWRTEAYDMILLAEAPSRGIRKAPSLELAWHLGPSSCSDTPTVPFPL